jgi:hypothetical protein
VDVYELDCCQRASQRASLAKSRMPVQSGILSTVDVFVFELKGKKVQEATEGANTRDLREGVQVAPEGKVTMWIGGSIFFRGRNKRMGRRICLPQRAFACHCHRRTGALFRTYGVRTFVPSYDSMHFLGQPPQYPSSRRCRRTAQGSGLLERGE